jgi:iron complex transport system substrate-binding protein
MPRVVSLIASGTEIVCALGRESDLVGRSHECDFPPSVKRLPAVSRPSFRTEGRSAAVDLAVKERLRRALSIYQVDPEALRGLEPDVIITQTQCEVCAVTPGDVERAVCDLVEKPARIVALEPNRLADVWSDMRRVADALGCPERGEHLVTELSGRVEAIARRARYATSRPGVATIEWIEPLMAAGNWMPELVELAGGTNLLGEAGKHSPWMSWEDLVAMDPEVVLVSPCGFDLARTSSELGVLISRAEWQGLRAVREDRVYLADGNAYFHRPGPRLVESLEILVEILHPELFQFGHEGRGWIRLTDGGRREAVATFGT